MDAFRSFYTIELADVKREEDLLRKTHANDILQHQDLIREKERIEAELTDLEEGPMSSFNEGMEDLRARKLEVEHMSSIMTALEAHGDCIV